MARLLLAVTLLAFVAVALADKDAELSKLKSLLNKIEKMEEKELAKEKKEVQKPVVHHSKKDMVRKAKTLMIKAKMDEEKEAKQYSGGSWSGWSGWTGSSWSSWSGSSWSSWSGSSGSGSSWSSWSESSGSGSGGSYHCEVENPAECCLWATDMCDGWDDCNGWDEDAANCDSACDQTGGFKCNDGACIPDYWECDDYADCSDNEDEQNCEGSSNKFYSGSGSGSGPGSYYPGSYSGSGSGPGSYYPGSYSGSGSYSGHGGPAGGPGGCSCCSPDMLSCDNECYPGYWVCDGYEDCSDGSDEAFCAKKSPKEMMMQKIKSYSHTVVEKKEMSFDDKLAYALRHLSTGRKMTIEDVRAALKKIHPE